MFCYCVSKVKKTGCSSSPSSSPVPPLVFFKLSSLALILGKGNVASALQTSIWFLACMKNTLEKKGRCVALWLLLNNKTLCPPLQLCVIYICLFENHPDWLCGSLGLSGCSWDEHQAAGTVKAFPESSSGALCTCSLTLADISNKKNVLQVGIIPSLICFNEVGVEE